MKKKKDLYISAVIVAAGQSRRMGKGMNKQYIDVSGKPVVARTIQVFDDCDSIDEIIVVINGQDIVYCKQNILDEYLFRKVRTLTAGGVSRQESVLNGLNQVDARCDIVLIHDGARPFISEPIIEKCIDSAIEYGGACAAVPVKDTLKIADNRGFITKTPDRSYLWHVQTPQAFKYSLIMEAYKRAQGDGFIATDDAMLMERLGFAVILVKGEYSNIKITTPEDLMLAEAIACLDGGGM